MASISKKQGRENWVNSDIRTALAGEAIAFKRACVKLSSGEIIKCTADTDVAVGLTRDSYADGDQGEYVIRGRLLFVATGDVAVGDPLCPDDGTSGNMRTAVSGDLAFGRAVDAAATGEFAVGEFDFANPHLIA